MKTKYIIPFLLIIGIACSKLNSEGEGSSNKKVYVGLGGATKDFYRYDPSNDVWTKLADFPGKGESGGVAFAVGEKGYVLRGNTADFYRYDPVSSWEKVADFIGGGRFSAVAFVVGEPGKQKAYVGLGGMGTGGYTKDFYRYDPVSGWEKVADFVGEGRLGAVAFVVGEPGEQKAYVGLGIDGMLNSKKDFYRYNPSGWEKVADFIGEGRLGAVAFVVGEPGEQKAYVGLGRGSSTDKYFKDFYRYDPSGWKKVVDFPGEVEGNTVTFVADGKAYVLGKGREDFYRYDPVSGWKKLKDLPENVKIGPGAVAFSLLP
ncbi:MAG: hypothetical protein MI674_02565 [Cytophagales bacterium]|nr:hypothetical protein [Cytophagales bacterium]